MREPIFIEPIFQKDSGDCAICSLAMLLGKPYVSIVEAAPTQYLGRKYRPVKEGLTGKMMIEIAAKFGARLVMRRKYQLDEDTGILTVLKANVRKPTSTHAVVLAKGTIIDPVDARFWPDADIFLEHENYRAGTLLVVEH